MNSFRECHKDPLVQASVPETGNELRVLSEPVDARCERQAVGDFVLEHDGAAVHGRAVLGQIAQSYTCFGTSSMATRVVMFTRGSIDDTRSRPIRIA